MPRSEIVRSLFTTGLRNAHALEKEAIQLIERQLERLEHYPDVEARMRQHLAETHEQHARLDQILDSLGEDRSIIKDTMMSFMGNMAAMAHMPSDDEILKNSFANFAFENYEAASYQGLITMAEAGGFRDAQQLLALSLREEQAMARWLEDNLQTVVLRHIELREMDERADV